jgi:hypothetical protein
MLENHPRRTTAALPAAAAPLGPNPTTSRAAIATRAPQMHRMRSARYRNVSSLKPQYGSDFDGLVLMAWILAGAFGCVTLFIGARCCG